MNKDRRLQRTAFLLACLMPIMAGLTACGERQAVQDQSLLVDQPLEWLVQGDDIWIPVIGDLGLHLRSAQKARAAGQRDQTASNLRQAARLLEQKLDSTNDAEKKHLSRAIAELRALSRRIEAGETIGERQMATVFKDVYQANTDQLWVVIDDEAWVVYAHLPQIHLSAAREAYTAGKHAEAVRELRKAAALLELEESHAVGRDESSLTGMAHAVKKLAEDVATNVEVPVQRFDDINAYAVHGLTYHQHELAAELLAADDISGANKALHNAAIRLERGDAWRPEIDNTQTVEQARKTQTLLQEDSVPKEQVKLAVDRIEDLVRQRIVQSDVPNPP